MANKYTHRYLAKIVIEATTPLSVGSGEKEIISDAMVVKDINGLPYIPGTSLAGVVRHAIGKSTAEKFFGYQYSESNGRGSDIIFSSAQMIGEEGKVLDGLIDKKNLNSDFYKHFENLPVRQHVKISDKGTSLAEDRGKFNEQIVYKGTRFCFEIEMLADASDESKNLFNSVLEKLSAQSFSIGSGTRSGLGKMKVIKEHSKVACLNLKENEHLANYLDKSSNLAEDRFWNKPYIQPFNANDSNDIWSKYDLTLQSDDFFLFGSGYGNEKANITPVKEHYIKWTNNRPEFVFDNILIPASSVKGALAHRVAFYYNKLTGQFADQENKATVGSENPAVYALFGSENSNNPQIGNILFFDILIEKSTTETKVLNHVAIDRFTGGAIDGALFSEEVNYGNGQGFSTQILLNKGNIKKVISGKFSETEPEVKAETVFKSLQLAINDLCNEMLPLGGGVNRGNGCFNGTCNPKIEE